MPKIFPRKNKNFICTCRHCILDRMLCIIRVQYLKNFLFSIFITLQIRYSSFTQAYSCIVHIIFVNLTLNTTILLPAYILNILFEVHFSKGAAGVLKVILLMHIDLHRFALCGHQENANQLDSLKAGKRCLRCRVIQRQNKLCNSN